MSKSPDRTRGKKPRKTCCRNRSRPQCTSDGKELDLLAKETLNCSLLRIEH